jgi:iron complex transport system substrate-binding protein
MSCLARVIVWIALLVLIGAPSHARAEAGPAALNPACAKATAKRIISMNPSLTRTLIALDAADLLVGVDEYSATTEKAVSGLPRVGGLFNPSLEGVLALNPDLVVLVPSVAQRDFRSRLDDLGVEALAFPNLSFDELLDSIQALGDRVGRCDAARERVAAIRSVWSEVAQAVSGRPRRTAVLIIQRDPLYVAGAGSYLNTMLEAAGLDNVAAKYAESYPLISLEWLIAAGPEVIVDSTDDPTLAAQYWSRWPSIPAVSNGAVIPVQKGIVTLPGPYIDRSLQTLADAIGAQAPVSNAPAGEASP